MAVAYGFSHHGRARCGLMKAPAVDLRVRPRRLRLPRHGPGDHRGRLVRPGDRQRPVDLRAVAHRGDPERQAEIEAKLRLRPRLREGQALPRGERRRRQHLQGHRQAGAHRHGRRRRHHDDLLDHHAAHQRPAERSRSSILHAAVPARLDQGRRRDLLVHRRVDAGRHHRRLPRGRVHQGNIRLEGATKASTSRTRKKVVEICTQYAQKGMFNIFIASSSRPSPSRSSSRSSSSAT